MGLPGNACQPVFFTLEVVLKCQPAPHSMESLFKHSGPIPGVSLSVALEWDLRICLSISSPCCHWQGWGHTLRTTALGKRELNLVTPGFLNLSPTDILDWITVVEGYLVHYRMLSILGLYSMLRNHVPLPQVNCHNQKCL